MSESSLSKLDVDDSIFDREAFVNDLAKKMSRDDLKEFIEKLNQSCTTLKTERKSFINDKYAEVIDSIQILTQVESRFVSTKNVLEEIFEKVDGINNDYDTVFGNI